MEITTAVIIPMRMSIIVHSIHAHQMNSDVIMADASSRHGSAITKTTVRMDLMNSTVNIHHVLRVNLHVLMDAVYHKVKSVMESMTVKITPLPMKPMRCVQQTRHVQRIISSAKRRIFVWNRIGCAMGKLKDINPKLHAEWNFMWSWF